MNSTIKHKSRIAQLPYQISAGKKVEGKMNQTSTSFKSPKNFTSLNSTQQSFGFAKKNQAPDSSTISATPNLPGNIPLKNIEEEEMEWIKAVKTIHNEESSKTPDINRVFQVTEEMLKDKP